MKLPLLLPFLLGFVVPAIAHNETNCRKLDIPVEWCVFGKHNLLTAIEEIHKTIKPLLLPLLAAIALPNIVMLKVLS